MVRMCCSSSTTRTACGVGPAEGCGTGANGFIASTPGGFVHRPTLSRHRRQGDPERAAGAGAAVQFDPPMMCRDQVANDREPEPEPAAELCLSGATVELVEDPPPVGWSHADA